jgi:hypothetical protein
VLAEVMEANADKIHAQIAKKKAKEARQRALGY